MKSSYVCAVFSAVLPLVLLALIVSASFANPSPFIWHDDMEGDVSGWSTRDLTAGAVPHFHWDTYMAFEGHSWWCGNFDYDTDGGYGNLWDDRLELQVDWVPVENVSWGALKARYREDSSGDRSGGARDEAMPILTFAFRHDSEIGYDFAYVQAESNGVYVNLNRGYDGKQAWTDIGAYGYDLSGYDDPLRVRFRFVSDGSYSDEDGLYVSVGGGFAADNIKIYDFATGEILFYDSEPGLREDECVPAIPGAAGDYWHLIDRACPAYSDPHSWWCGDDADTAFVPPNLVDALFSPIIDVGSYSCRTYLALHLAIPTVDNDYMSIMGTIDGYNYYHVISYWGDFESCEGWGGTAFDEGYDLSQFGGINDHYAGVAFIMYTTDNGCGPAVGGDAGVMIDDLWFCTLGGQPWGDKRTVNLYDAETPYGIAKSDRAPVQLRHW